MRRVVVLLGAVLSCRPFDSERDETRADPADAGASTDGAAGDAAAAGRPDAGARDVPMFFPDGGSSHRYEVVAVPEGLTWTVADKAAVERGGYLATITSEAESAFVWNLVLATPGATDRKTTGQNLGPWLGGVQKPGQPLPEAGWSWVSGERWGFTKWAQGEPNEDGIEDHLHYYSFGTMNYAPTWSDGVNTNRIRGYVIEFDP